MTLRLQHETKASQKTPGKGKSQYSCLSFNHLYNSVPTLTASLDSHLNQQHFTLAYVWILESEICH